jgi:hypothetical protein
MQGVQYSPENLSALAAECHAIADQMSHSITKRTMLRLAMSYERLARHAQERAEIIAKFKIVKQD